MIRQACRAAVAATLFGVGIGVVGLVPPAMADSATYTYDGLGRIVTVAYANGTTVTYTYDIADNRLTQTVTCSGSGC